MRQRYIDLMEKALSAYTDEHIQGYFSNVKKDGLSEHGFPRLYRGGQGFALRAH